MKENDIPILFEYFLELVETALVKIKSTGKFKNELCGLLEILKLTTLGKIFCIFIELNFLFLIRAIQVLTEPKKNENEQINQKRMERTNLYILCHLDENIRERDVADFIGMSVTNFCRVFKQTTQCCFNEYLNRYRIGVAENMLQDSNAPVADIAYRCGFNSPNHFNRTFKKIKGISPKKYREEAVVIKS